jgi:TPR repeat protein
VRKFFIPRLVLPVVPRFRTHYDNLKVSRTASDLVIRAAYKALMQHYHPDKYVGSKPEALRISKLLNHSFETLIDPAKRNKYDRWLDAQESHPSTASTAYLRGAVKAGPCHSSEIASKPKAEATQLADINASSPRFFSAISGITGISQQLSNFLRRFKMLIYSRKAIAFFRVRYASKLREDTIFADKSGFSALSERAYYLFEQSRFAEIVPLARHGDPIATLMLAAMYERGCGIGKNPQQANHWYQLAHRELQPHAQRGDVVAEFFLAIMYREGFGVFYDEERALEWLNKAVAQGYAKAQYELGCLYLEGHIVAKNLSQAIYLLTQAGLQGLVAAQSRLGLIYAAESLENNENILENQQKSYFWYNKAADQGDYFSQFALAKMYANGRGAPRNMQKAIYWHTKAAEQGWIFAQSALAGLYAHGIGVPQDYILAYMWWEIADSQGHQNAGRYKAEIAEKLTSSQIDRARCLSSEWLQTHPARI